MRSQNIFVCLSYRGQLGDDDHLSELEAATTTASKNLEGAKRISARRRELGGGQRAESLLIILSSSGLHFLAVESFG
jgi:hypothetical protein